MGKKMSLLLLIVLFLLALMLASTLAAKAMVGKIEPKTTCWWVYSGERWCYYCCNHPECLPATCCVLYCE